MKILKLLTLFLLFTVSNAFAQIDVIWDDLYDAYIPSANSDILYRLGSASHGGAYSNQVLPSTCDWQYTLEVSHTNFNAIAASTTSSIGDPNMVDYGMYLINQQAWIKYPGTSSFVPSAMLNHPRGGYTHLKLTKDGSNIKYWVENYSSTSYPNNPINSQLIATKSFMPQTDLHPECILDWNQGYIAHPRMILCGTNGTSTTCDEDWYVENTEHAPCDIYDNIFHMGRVGIGTKNPTWNFRTTINNGSDLSDSENPIYVDRNSLELRNYVGPHNNWGYAQMTRVDNVTTKALAIRNDNFPMFPDVFYINGDGTAFTQGMFVMSDKRYKENITKLENLEEKLFSLEGYKYNYKGKTSKDLGFVAQEVKEAFPELVNENEKGFLSVNYVGLIPVITEVLKKQNEELEESKEEIASLKDELGDLQSQIDMINANLKAICNNDCGSVKFVESSDVNDNFTIFPNPTSETFQIKSTNTQITEFENIRIISLSGNLVFEGDHISIDRNFEVRDFANGVYLVEILTNGSIEKLRIEVK